jgi:4-alpha-glucanotransferase
MTNLAGRRQVGLLIPLFSCPSTASWGIGDIADVPNMTAWLAQAGLGVLQLLPLNEMAPDQQSPYSAISAMAIDPIFLRITDVPDFEALGGEASLAQEERARLADVRQTTRIDYPNVRLLKNRTLRAAFERFVDAEWSRGTERAAQLKRFLSQQAWWIEDYAVFRAIHAHEQERPWTLWSVELQRREPSAIDRARRELAHEVLFHQYLQWLAALQWQQARAAANGVAIYGDLPFMVDGDSADVWARQQHFRLDASTGVPPDAFSPTGQDWGTPVYRWDAMALEDFRWLRERARRSADLFDGYRVDHLVGFYRTYGRLKQGGEAFFTPADEPTQTALGEKVLKIFYQSSVNIIAEDLGTVPDFVRASLARLGIPGFRVFRWERHWHTDGQPFRDPAEYPKISVATSGTHDTEPLVVWWQHASKEDKQSIDELSTIQQLTGGARLSSATDESIVCDVLLEAIFASGSNLVLLPVQDVFGWRDRINEPGTVNDRNWTFRLPWPSNRLDAVAEAGERQRALRGWSQKYGRL